MSAVCALDSVACAVASDHCIELKTCKWLSDDTGQILKHRIVLTIDPQSALVYCLQDLRHRLVAAIADARSVSDRVHYFHLSLDGPSTQVELGGSQSIFASSNLPRFAPTTLSAQCGAVENKSDTDSSTATLLLEGLAQQEDVALAFMPSHATRQRGEEVRVGSNMSPLPPSLCETVGDVRPQPAHAQRIWPKWKEVPCLVPHCWYRCRAPLFVCGVLYHGPASYRCERCHLHTSFQPRRFIATF